MGEEYEMGVLQRQGDISACLAAYSLFLNISGLCMFEVANDCSGCVEWLVGEYEQCVLCWSKFYVMLPHNAF